MSESETLDRIHETIFLIENEGGKGEGTSDEGTLPVWYDELWARGYEVHVSWDHKPWGVATVLTAWKDGGRIRILCAPKVPPFVGKQRSGKLAVYVDPPEEGSKINAIVLVRNIHPKWSLVQARECVLAGAPLYSEVDEETADRAARYLDLVGAKIRWETLA